MSKKQGQRPAKDVLKDSFREIYGGKKKECQHSGAVDGKTNYALLCRLLASLGSKVLRDVFDGLIHPQDLCRALQREPVHSKLLSLRKQEILSPEQWSKLYPVNPSSVLSTDFESDLLIVLLRTICNLSPPATGWDLPPDSLDTSCVSDIVRLKYFINAVSTHAEKDSVSDAVTFCEYKDEIQKTLVRLGGDEYNDAICEMEKQEMGLLDKERFKGLLKQWKDGDDRIKDKLKNWECIMKTSRDADPVQPEASCANVVSAAGRSTTHGHHEHEIADCESDIRFFAKRHDPDTRNWLFDDFNKWFSDPGESRAYVLLGDAGVGKSVIAGALAQRMKEHLGAACFCRHYDDTRNDPRYLLGTLASQLCKCNSRYNNTVGGIDGVITMLHNNKLGVQELFTKLLEEPLAKCTHLAERKLVIIDALDETEYESREDFLFLIKERFPRLPHWLLFFITSRPEDKIRERLEKYNPCVRICAGDSEQHYIYQQHEGDIRRFLQNGVDFSLLPFTVEEIAKSCNGLFLHAFYLRKKLNDLAKTGKMDYTLSDLLVDDVEDFFRDNFQRVFSRVGKDLYEKLIGCILAAPSPLPVSFIPFVLQQEKSSLDEQEVIDAVMQFAWNQTSNDTVTFLHKRIPTWLTKNPRTRDYQRKTKRKDCPHLLIDKKKAEEYLARIFEETLSGIVTEPLPACPCINENLQDYAFRFAIRFLCEYGDQELVGTVFRCLTSLHFLEKRVESGKIGIYHLLEDLKLASCCPAFKDLHKKNILHEISNALESNVHILLEAPHLLISCLRNGSKVLQETGLIPKLLGPWLEWSAFPECLPGFHVFATASDQRTVVASNGRSIVFVDASRLTIVSGPFEVSQLTIKEIKHLEFSPDGKWVFFGRLDKWFSVERKSVEDFSQFSGNKIIYEKCAFTRDDQYIVVEGTGAFLVSCECAGELLALWALQEIHHNRSEMTCFPLPSIPFVFRRSAKRWRSSDCLGGSVEQLVVYLEAPESYEPVEPFVCLVPCNHCTPFCKKLGALLQSVYDSSLRAVRQLIVELYPYIFDFQVWNVHNGRPLLYDVFSLSVQLNEFTYFWHVRHGRQLKGLYGITAKASSISNIAVANAVYAVTLSEMHGELRRLRVRRFLDKEAWLTRKREGHPEEDIRRRVPRLSRILFAFSRMNSHLLLKDDFSVSFISVSPRQKWLLLSYWDEPNILRVYSVSEANEEQYFLDANCILRKLEPFCYFTFTNDDSYFIYSTSSGSLYALCLQTGTALKSVTGTNLCVFKGERQVGYSFQSKSEKKAIYLTDLFSPLVFLRLSSLIHGSAVSKSAATTFISSDSLKAVSSNSLTTSLQFMNESMSPTSDASLASSRVLQNVVFSANGKSIAFRDENKVKLCSVSAEFVEVQECCTIFDQTSSLTAVISFSTDSQYLLVCIRDKLNDQDFYVWDVEKQQLSVKFKLSGCVIFECFCLSPDKTKLILCCEYEIHIWKYCNGTCCLLERIGVERFYSSVKFSQCIVSLDNELLVCCIANIIILYSLRVPGRIFQSKRSFRGHLGRVEFCKFLKINRYLISYGIDGVVFLWDLEKAKAVGFAKITQNQESIVGMAVSPDEDRAVCFTSRGRICVVKLCNLGMCLSLKLLTAPTKHETNSAEESPQSAGEMVSTISAPCAEDELEFSSSESEEDMFSYYLEHDDIDEFD
ncbi:uncharacterized protein [Montipora capricornis]|uniref:uncharacterized protein isoform X3 n=1 Tax=Montipora capricornis TaxID=246305 RepID=UPI0035F15031